MTKERIKDAFQGTPWGNFLKRNTLYTTWRTFLNFFSIVLCHSLPTVKVMPTCHKLCLYNKLIVSGGSTLKQIWLFMGPSTDAIIPEFIASGLRVYTWARDCTMLSWGGIALAGRGSGQSACQPANALLQLSGLQRDWLEYKVATVQG